MSCPNVLSEKQQQYNKTLARADKAHIWMDDPATTQSDVDKHLPEYNKIVISLSTMIQEFEVLLGRKLTEDEILKGIYADIRGWRPLENYKGE